MRPTLPRSDSRGALVRAPRSILAIGLAAVMTAASLSFAGAATAAPEPSFDDSAVTLPLSNAGEGAFVSVSKTQDLADGETIRVSGRLNAAAVQFSEGYLVSQAGAAYQPAGSADAVALWEGRTATAPFSADSSADWRTFSVDLPVAHSLTHAKTGEAFDGIVQQTYLALGGARALEPDENGVNRALLSVNPTASLGGIWATQYVPLTFVGGADDLLVDERPEITEHPTAFVQLDSGDELSLSAGATGSPTPDLQWQVSEDNAESWSSISGATGSTFTTTVSAADDGLQYRLRAKNRISTVHTSTTALAVTPEAPQPEPEPLTIPDGAFGFGVEGDWAKAPVLIDVQDGQSIDIEAFYTTLAIGYTSSWEEFRNPNLSVRQMDEQAGMDSIYRQGGAVLLEGVAGVDEHGREGHAARGSIVLSRIIIDRNTGIETDCLVTQCYLAVGGAISDPIEYYTVQDQTAVADALFSTKGGRVDSESTGYLPIFFAGTELVPPVVPEPEPETPTAAPAITTQPVDVAVAEGYAAVYTVDATGEPAPTFQWQRSVDGGASWQTIRGSTSASLRITSSASFEGYQYRARVTNALGTVYSEAASLSVTAGNDNGNDPNAPFAKQGVSLDWSGSTELQKRSPAFTPNYYSAGVSEGNEATYKNVEGNAVVAYRDTTGAESVQTYENRGRSNGGSGIQFVRLNNGAVTNDGAGGGSIRWDATWSINFYGGLVPFTMSDPTLTWDATGAGTLTADLSGYGSSMDNPNDKFPLEPVVGARIATFSNATIDEAGNLQATPDWAGVEIDAPSDAAPQDRTGENWGAWPQEFVAFQFLTGLSSYWYTSGGAADPDKAGSPFTVSGLYGYTIEPGTPVEPEATVPAAPTGVDVVSTGASTARATWSAPADGGAAITGYTVTATPAEGEAITATSETPGAELVGLTAEVTYRVTVTASNRVGESTASEPVEYTPDGTTPVDPIATVPGLVSDALASLEGTAAIISWTAPADDGGAPITGYTVTLAPDGRIVEVGADETTARFDALGAGVETTASIVAHNAQGDSEAVVTNAVTVVEPETPEEPGPPGSAPFVLPEEAFVADNSVDFGLGGVEYRPGQPIAVRYLNPGSWYAFTVHSDPSFLGWYQADESGAVDGVLLPSTVEGSSHRFVVQDVDGGLIGWQGITFTVADPGTPTPGTPTPGTETPVDGGVVTVDEDPVAGQGTGGSAGPDGLATTGADPVRPLAAGVLVLLAGLALIAVRRRRELLTDGTEARTVA